MKFLDSDVMIDFLNGKATKDIEKLIISEEILYTSVMNVYEINKGLKNEIIADRFFSRFTILNIDQNTVKIAVSAYKDLKSKGQLVKEFDIFIAAAATSQNAQLTTRNKKDFLRIQKVMPELKLL